MDRRLKTLTRAYVNLAITGLLAGIWRGGSWTLAVWRVYSGLGLARQRLIVDTVKSSRNSLA